MAAYRRDVVFSKASRIHRTLAEAEFGRELLEHLVHHGANWSQRMVLAHPLVRRNVAEDMILLLVRSSHALLDVLHDSSLHKFGLFQQPARVYPQAPAAFAQEEAESISSSLLRPG